MKKKDIVKVVKRTIIKGSIFVGFVGLLVAFILFKRPWDLNRTGGSKIAAQERVGPQVSLEGSGSSVRLEKGEKKWVTQYVDKDQIEDGIDYTLHPEVLNQDGINGSGGSFDDSGENEGIDGLPNGDDFMYQYDSDGNVTSVYDTNDDGELRLYEEVPSKVTKDKSKSESSLIPDETREIDNTANTDNGGYTKNKDYVNDFTSGEVDDIIKRAKVYIDLFYNIDYRDIDTAGEFNKRKELILKYYAPLRSTVTAAGSSMDNELYVKTWLNLVKIYHLNMNAKFYTDNTLIYGNPATVVRGRLVYNIAECDNTKKIFDFNNMISSGEESNRKRASVGKTYNATAEFTFTTWAYNKSMADWEPSGTTVDKAELIGDVAEGDIK